MRIDSSNIGMESVRSYSSVSRKTKGFYAMNSDSEGTQKNNSMGKTFSDLMNPEEEKEERTSGSTLEDLQYRLRSTGRIRQVSNRQNYSVFSELKQRCMFYILEMLFAKREGKTGAYRDFSQETSNEMNEISNRNAMNYSSGQLSLQPIKVDSLLYHESSYYQETESTTVTTQGTVRTQDGREITFNLEIGMSRSFEAYYEQNYGISTLEFKDPLVIQLEDNITGLSDQKFYFDLDGDGEEENISQLGRGNGFLALDKNGDGVINDGNELFGTKSGDGFADLAAYDEDHNGWIDENDAIWDKLQIWTKDQDGNDQLYHLKDKGVGAICLSRVASDFSLTDENNSVLGKIRSTGIFLYENGNVGTVQQLDLAN